MSEGGYLVALDTQLSEELIGEGLARDAVRRLNEWRKEAGFEVQDRIHVRYRASPRLAAAIEAHKDFVMAETLAVSLAPGDPTGRGFTARAEFSGEWLEVELERA